MYRFWYRKSGVWTTSISRCDPGTSDGAVQVVVRGSSYDHSWFSISSEVLHISSSAVHPQRRNKATQIRILRFPTKIIFHSIENNFFTFSLTLIEFTYFLNLGYYVSFL